MRLFAALAALLALLVPSAAAEPPPPVQDPATVRELAEEILARDEFQPPERSLLERIGDWLDDLLGGDSGDGASGGDTEVPAAGSGGSSPLSALLFVLAAVAVGYVVFLLVRAPRRRRAEEVEDPLDEVEPHRNAAEWRSDAERFEAEGRWKEGLRCRFRSLVEVLVEARAVAELAGRTTGELRADLRASVPDAAEPFDAAATLFDRAWYGDLPTGPDEARRFAAAAGAVVAAVARRPAADPAPVEVDA